MKLKDLQSDHLVQAHVAGQATAGTADEFVIGRAPFRCTVEAVYYTPKAAVTGAATNNFAVQLTNRGQAGAGTTAVASLTFANGTDADAFDEAALTLAASAADLVLAEGDVISFDKVVNGTGMAMPSGAVTVVVQSV